jgi:hypothetical protein
VDGDSKHLELEVDFSLNGLWDDFMSELCSKISIAEAQIRFVKLGDVIIEDDIDIFHLEKSDVLTVITSKDSPNY